MVDLESKLNSLRVNRLSRLDFPTPESPINTTSKKRQKSQPGARAMVGGGAHRVGSVGTFEEELCKRLRLAHARARKTGEGQKGGTSYIVLVVGHGCGGKLCAK